MSDKTLGEQKADEITGTLNHSTTDDVNWAPGQVREPGPSPEDIRKAEARQAKTEEAYRKGREVFDPAHTPR